MNMFDRREALAIAGGLAAISTSATAARAAIQPPKAIEPLPLPHATMFPRTQYFEFDSVKAGARYGVWVTVPSSYEASPSRLFPAIYTPDGNAIALLAPQFGNAGTFDPINPVHSSIQISVGYTGEDIRQALAVRARDLLPPKEALPDGLIAGMRADNTNNLLDRQGTELYIHNLENPAGDRFLAFLTEELHPVIAAAYRIDPEAVGLFGHSYGGLFATYAALQPTSVFKNFGASSPGILADRSVVFQLYADAVAKGVVTPRSLHMTAGIRELTAPTLYAPLVGAGTSEFIAKAATTPVKGLTFTSHLIENESHVSVLWPAFFSFLRTLYPIRA